MKHVSHSQILVAWRCGCQAEISCQRQIMISPRVGGSMVGGRPMGGPPMGYAGAGAAGGCAAACGPACGIGPGEDCTACGVGCGGVGGGSSLSYVGCGQGDYIEETCSFDSIKKIEIEIRENVHSKQRRRPIGMWAAEVISMWSAHGEISHASSLVAAC